jgi:hypothetical protein
MKTILEMFDEQFGTNELLIENKSVGRIAGVNDSLEEVTLRLEHRAFVARMEEIIKYRAIEEYEKENSKALKIGRAIIEALSE